MKKIFFIIMLLPFLFLWSCKNNISNESTKKAVAKTPVTAVKIHRETIQNEIWLNAVSTLLNKSPVQSILNGYIIKSSLQPGQAVSAGQVLFVLKAKEAEVIGSKLPDSLKISGKVVIKAAKSGYISQLNHLQGDYVQNGAPLCVIADKNSFVFKLQVPFALNNKIQMNKRVQMRLPDGIKITAKIISKMPTLNAASQTLQYLLRVNPALSLPEKLVAKVKIITNTEKNVQVLPKSAVLSDESLSHFWVMKMMNDSIAVKVPIQKGIENSNRVAILSPKFKQKTKILTSGNYGLPDTANVKLTKTMVK